MKAHTHILALLLLAGGFVFGQALSAQAAKPAPTPAKPVEPKLDILNFISLSPLYYYHDYKETRMDEYGKATTDNGNEYGGILGGSVEYIIHLYNPNLFFGADGFFSDSKTTADLKMWNGEKNTAQTENMFVLGQIIVGYTFDIAKEFKLDVSTGIGLRAWNRYFLMEDKNYSDETYVFFTPYNLAMELTLMDRIALGLEGTIRLLFNGKNTVNLTNYPGGPYKNPELLMASDISYRVGIVGRYIIQTKKDEKNFFAIRSITINPYLDHWATGQSDYEYVLVQKSDGTYTYVDTPEHLEELANGQYEDSGDEDNVLIQKWLSTTNAWGLRITVDLFF